MTVTTLTITLVLKLTSNFARNFSMTSGLWKVGDAEREIGFHIAGFRDDDLLDPAGQTLVPGLQFVSARRHLGNGITASFVGGREEGIFQDQDNAVHPRVNGTK